MSLIAVRQINQQELTDAIAVASSGATFSGNLQAYLLGSGWAGPNVVYTTGANQTISGVKTFIDAPFVPYAGATGTAASKGFVDNSILAASGQILLNLVTTDTAQSITAAKIFDLPVTVATPTNSGHAVNAYYLSGVSGVLAAAGGGGGGTPNAVTTTGNEVIGGFKQFTGSPLVPDPTQPSGVVNLNYLSGVSGVLLAAGGAGSPNSVTTTGNEVIGGFKQFTGSPFVPDPTQPSGAVNLSYLSGVSGVLNAAIGAGGGSTYYITGTGTVNILTTGVTVTNTINSVSGTVNTYNSIYEQTYTTLITGNFYNIAFFLDPVQTGLNLFEAFVSTSFYVTGAAFACRTSGYGSQNGGIMTGKIYQVDFNNAEQTVLNFTIQSGVIYSGTPTLNVVVTGGNRVGLSLSNMLSGMEKFSVGIFGGGYA